MHSILLLVDVNVPSLKMYIFKNKKQQIFRLTKLDNVFSIDFRGPWDVKPWKP